MSNPGETNKREWSNLPPSLDNWKFSGKYFKYGNSLIFYKDEGRGETLLCIHGFPTASWDWHHLWPELTKRFRVIAPDMIGFGFSDKPIKYAYSIFDQATLCEELLQHLDVQEVHLLAHDYGDTVAQELLARYEERRRSGVKSIKIKSICLLNGGIFPEATHPRLIQKLLASPLGFVIEKLISEKNFRKSFSAIFGPQTKPLDTELRAFWSLVTHNDGLTVSHKLIGYMAERWKHRDRWVAALQRASVPVRLINGLADPVSGASIVVRYRELVPNADIVCLKDIGHYPQLESPGEMLTAFLDFIDKAKSKSH